MSGGPAQAKEEGMPSKIQVRGCNDGQLLTTALHLLFSAAPLHCDNQLLSMTSPERALGAAELCWHQLLEWREFVDVWLLVVSYGRSTAGHGGG